ncbi:hypothetical protein VCHA43P282_30067 [Vibrio chagasii]|nr:hypothetical protein VCHA43P282_30067 [Vibrio chagasii]
MIDADEPKSSWLIMPPLLKKPKVCNRSSILEAVPHSAHKLIIDKLSQH